MQIPLDKILPNPEQPRRLFDQAGLDELAQSIRENGVIQPVVVEEIGDGFFFLHDGERRWRAARLAGLVEIPAAVVPGLNGNGTEQRLLRALIANIQREDLSHIDEARAYRRLQEHGLNVREIAKRTGKAATVIYSKLELLDLEPEIQELIHLRKIGARPDLVLALKKIPDSRERVQLVQKAAERGLTANSIIRAANALAAERRGKRPTGEETSLELATERQGKPDLPRWNALVQVGRVLPWDVVEEAARATCRGCVLVFEASSQVCGQCPAVSILEAMLAKAQR